MGVVTTMIDSPTFGLVTFDAVFNTQHDMGVTVTQHPVQTGSSIADHAFTNPYEVSCEIGMTDVTTGVGHDHSVNTYALLVELMEKKEPFTLLTRLKTYRDMLVTAISAPDDYTTQHALKAQIYFQRINIVKVATVKVQITVTASQQAQQTGTTTPAATTQPAATTPSGTSTPSTSSSGNQQSILYQIFKGGSTSQTTKASGSLTSNIAAKASSLLTGK